MYSVFRHQLVYLNFRVYYSCPTGAFSELNVQYRP
jgi:hypothetical protein